MQIRIEKLVARGRFSMQKLYAGVWPLIEKHAACSAHIGSLRARFTEKYYRIGYAILRHAFLIELVKIPAIQTTKVRVRWYKQLNNDPRFCTFDECIKIAADLLSTLANGWLTVPQHSELLTLFLDHSILPYEVPLDYISRPALADGKTKIHRLGNIKWICTDTMLRTLKLRKFLTSPDTSPDAAFFRRVLNDKIKVKTYLTDRALTGEYKTNREKRLEVHPQSVQFADRHSCMAIEYVLIKQLCAFDGFPVRHSEAPVGCGVR